MISITAKLVMNYVCPLLDDWTNGKIVKDKRTVFNDIIHNFFLSWIDYDMPKIIDI